MVVAARALAELRLVSVFARIPIDQSCFLIQNSHFVSLLIRLILHIVSPTHKSRLFRIRERINHPDWPALSRLIDAKTLLRWNIKIICELNYVPTRYIVLSIFFKYSLSWLFLIFHWTVEGIKLLIVITWYNHMTMREVIHMFVAMYNMWYLRTDSFPTCSMEHVTILACRNHPCQSLWSTSENEGLKLQ